MGVPPQKCFDLAYKEELAPGKLRVAHLPEHWKTELHHWCLLDLISMIRSTEGIRLHWPGILCSQTRQRSLGLLWRSTRQNPWCLLGTDAKEAQGVSSRGVLVAEHLGKERGWPGVTPAAILVIQRLARRSDPGWDWPSFTRRTHPRDHYRAAAQSLTAAHGHVLCWPHSNSPCRAKEALRRMGHEVSYCHITGQDKGDWSGEKPNEN